MKGTYCLNLNIFGINVSLDTSGCEKIYKFLTREFSDFIEKDLSKPDITIKFRYDEYKKPECYDNYTDCLIYSDGRIAQNIKGTFRNIWIVYDISINLGPDLEIFLPQINDDNTRKIKNELLRVTSSRFIYSWQSSLIDFFQGPFIGIIQLQLIKKGATFIHAGAIGTEDKKGIVLAGWAQSGKSTIVEELMRTKHWKFIAEDYCIINNKPEIISYSKHRGISLHVGDGHSNKPKRVGLEDIFERINGGVFGWLKAIGAKPVRIVAIEENFRPQDRFQESQLHSIVYIKRSAGNDCTIVHRSPQDISNMCVNMMMAEMKNIAGLFDLLSCYGVIKREPNIVVKMFESMANLYIDIFSRVKTYELKIPNFKEIDIVIREIDKVFRNNIML